MQFNFFIALKKVVLRVWDRLLHGFFQGAWVTFLLLFVVTLLMFIPGSQDTLKFSNYRILEQGEWWRVVTSPFVHKSWDHYTWNAIVLFASSLVCEQINRKAFVLYLLVMLIVNAVFKLTWYNYGHVSLGFSGVASGTFVLLLMLIIGEGFRARDFWMMLIAGAILVMFSAHELGYFGSHTGWEMATGRSIDNTSGKKTKPAHVLGMATGLVVALSVLLTAAVTHVCKQRQKCSENAE